MDICRIEALNGRGWCRWHAAVALVNPERYAEQLASNGKVVRVTVLDERLQPTDQVYSII